MKRPDDDGMEQVDGTPADDPEIQRPFAPIRDRRWNLRMVHVIEPTSNELVRLFDLLSEAGFYVSPFSDPFDALEDIARYHPELAIADAHLPGMEGLELLARIKRMSPSTRVILTSGCAIHPAYQEVVEAGGETLIHAPFDSHVLLSAVERAFGFARKHRG
jgi:FixJ family two-component response regulator